MFEKKNQNILSEHYASIVDHSSTLLDPIADGDDDFITLVRTDHDLEDGSGPSAETTNLSKRKLKMGESKKASLKLKGAPTKLVFDEEGGAHEIYELVGEQEELAGKKGDEKEKFVELEREKLKEIDVVDREVARDKKREKKRKRKDREREVSPTSLRFL